MASKEVILDSEFATLWYHPDSKIIHHHFKKYAYGEHFRNVLDKGYEVLKENNAQKWLSDDRNISALKKEDGEWAETVWVPKVLEAGWKYWAMVLPKKVVGQMNLRHFINANAERGIVVNVFSDPEEALSWLESQ
ncbi:MAG: hypothetical protein ACOCSK_03110 [Rhodothermales bacterium]